MRNNSERKRMINLLYRSFDVELTEAERIRLEEALSDDPELRSEKKQIECVRKSVGELADSQFDPLFADRILMRLRDETTDDFFTALLWSFRRIVVIGAATIIILMLNNFISSGELSLESALGIPQPTLEEALTVNQFMGGR